MSTAKPPPRFDTGDKVSVYRTGDTVSVYRTGAWYEATIHSRYRKHQYFVIYKALLDSASHPLRELITASRIRAAAPQFRAGDEVEARPAAAGGGWYEACVDSPSCTLAGHYVLVYRTLNDSEGRPMREVVPGSEVRPRYPDRTEYEFEVDEPVEVRYKEGWWRGVVRRVPEGGVGWSGEYMVSVCKDFANVRCFPVLMRPRLRWVDGAWVASPRPQGNKQCETEKRMDSQIPPSLKQCEAGKRRDNQIPPALSPSQFEGKKQCETEKRMDSQIPLSLKQCEPGKIRDRQIPLSLNPSPSEGMKQCETGKQMDSQIPLSLKQRETGKGRDSQIPLSLNLSQLEGKKQLETEKRMDSQIPLSLKQCGPGKMRDRQIPLSLNPSQSEGKKQCETGKRMDSQIPLSPEQCETGKGRDSQIPLSLNLSQLEGKKECGTRKRKNIQIPLTTANQKRRISDMKTSAQGDSVTDHEESMPVNELSVEGRGSLTSELITEVDTLLKRMRRHELIDKMVGSPCSTLLETSKSQYQHDEVGSGHAALLSTPRVDIACDSATPVSNESHRIVSALPFVKRSPVWKYIDLEVVPKLSQHPHFRPLEQLPEVQREGIAVALMVNCQHLMKGCQSAIKTDSSCHNLDEYLKNIIDLERHGFGIQHLRDQLEELRRVRNTHTELLQEKSAAKGQTSEVNETSDNIDTEIEATDSTIMALTQVLRLLNERRTSLAKRKEASEAIKAKLHRKLRLADEELVSSERVVQDLVTAGSS